MENAKNNEIDGGSGDAKRDGSHEKKAESYLELARKRKNPVDREKFLKEALKEVKKALRQDEFSWTAQNVAGQVMKETGKAGAALAHFCRALAIRPGNEEIRREFNYCRSLEKATTAEKRGLKPFDLTELEERSRNGSVTARQAIKKIQLKSAAEELWKKFEGEGRQRTEPDNSAALIEVMYRYYAEPSVSAFHYPDDEEPHWEKFLDAMLCAHGNERGDLDRKIRLCFGNVSRSDEDFRVHVLLEAIRRYPEEIPLYRLLHAVVVKYVDVDKVPDDFERALLHAPNDVHLLYGLACTTSVRESATINANLPPVIKALERVTVEAPEDHELVPCAYYYLAHVYYMESQVLTAKGAKRSADGRRKLAETEKNMRDSFINGKTAESRILSHYLPLKCFEKRFIGSILYPFGEEDSDLEEEEEEEETRAEIVKSHRMLVKDKRGEIKVKAKVASKNEDGGCISADLEKLKLPSMAVSSCQHLKPIKLSEMDHSKDQTFQGRILNLTLVEDPVRLETALGSTCVRVIAKDESGAVIRLNVYNLPAEGDYESLLGFGSKLSVTNPSLGVTVDGEVVIQVEKPDVSLIENGKIEDTCRYCGRENARNTCAKCKRAQYCSKNCQVGDWKELGHKLICSSEN